jgi:hypothetical protein
MFFSAGAVSAGCSSFGMQTWTMRSCGIPAMIHLISFRQYSEAAHRLLVKTMAALDASMADSISGSIFPCNRS